MKYICPSCKENLHSSCDKTFNSASKCECSCGGNASIEYDKKITIEYQVMRRRAKKEAESYRRLRKEIKKGRIGPRNLNIKNN
ncbi:MAG TPA: hypothetical protein PKX15_04325 [Bacteroidales bacterium]|nr:hypothetical protein [Bacteroidales bacterium]